MNYIERREIAFKIRLLADEAWERGMKELSTELHALARKWETLVERRNFEQGIAGKFKS